MYGSNKVSLPLFFVVLKLRSHCNYCINSEIGNDIKSAAWHKRKMKLKTVQNANDRHLYNGELTFVSISKLTHPELTCNFVFVLFCFSR